MCGVCVCTCVCVNVCMYVCMCGVRVCVCVCVGECVCVCVGCKMSGYNSHRPPLHLAFPPQHTAALSLLTETHAPAFGALACLQERAQEASFCVELAGVLCLACNSLTASTSPSPSAPPVFSVPFTVRTVSSTVKIDLSASATVIEQLRGHSDVVKWLEAQKQATAGQAGYLGAHPVRPRELDKDEKPIGDPVLDEKRGDGTFVHKFARVASARRGKQLQHVLAQRGANSISVTLVLDVQKKPGSPVAAEAGKATKLSVKRVRRARRVATPLDHEPEGQACDDPTAMDTSPDDEDDSDFEVPTVVPTKKRRTGDGVDPFNSSTSGGIHNSKGKGPSTAATTTRADAPVRPSGRGDRGGTNFGASERGRGVVASLAQASQQRGDAKKRVHHRSEQQLELDSLNNMYQLRAVMEPLDIHELGVERLGSELADSLGYHYESLQKLEQSVVAGLADAASRLVDCEFDSDLFKRTMLHEESELVNYSGFDLSSKSFFTKLVKADKQLFNACASEALAVANIALAKQVASRDLMQILRALVESCVLESVGNDSELLKTFRVLAGAYGYSELLRNLAPIFTGHLNKKHVQALQPGGAASATRQEGAVDDDATTPNAAEGEAASAAFEEAWAPVCDKQGAQCGSSALPRPNVIAEKDSCLEELLKSSKRRRDSLSIEDVQWLAVCVYDVCVGLRGQLTELPKDRSMLKESEYARATVAANEWRKKVQQRNVPIVVPEPGFIERAIARNAKWAAEKKQTEKEGNPEESRPEAATSKGDDWKQMLKGKKSMGVF